VAYGARNCPCGKGVYLDENINFHRLEVSRQISSFPPELFTPTAVRTTGVRFKLIHFPVSAAVILYLSLSTTCVNLVRLYRITLDVNLYPATVLMNHIFTASVIFTGSSFHSHRPSNESGVTFRMVTFHTYENYAYIYIYIMTLFTSSFLMRTTNYTIECVQLFSPLPHPIKDLY
jgi:hypothetical protein